MRIITEKITRYRKKKKDNIWNFNRFKNHNRYLLNSWAGLLLSQSELQSASSKYFFVSEFSIFINQIRENETKNFIEFKAKSLSAQWTNDNM